MSNKFHIDLRFKKGLENKKTPKKKLLDPKKQILESFETPTSEKCYVN
ncbi:hypothetical protein G134_1968 [Lactobacillus delbrueckii subsp. lactis CRL581]|nr:hypothetical protein G134_1968 [Lactobacillus delbrueckii subsp. lactis CRL581]